MKHCSKCVYTFSSRQRISVIMQDGSAENQSVCLYERSLPLEKHWIVLHSIKPLCDVKCKVGCWGGLRHPFSVFICLRGAQLYQIKGFLLQNQTSTDKAHRAQRKHSVFKTNHVCLCAV